MRIFLFALGGALILDDLYLLATANGHSGHAAQGLFAAFLILFACLYRRLKRSLRIAAACLCAVPLLLGAALAVYGNLDRADYREDAVIVLGAGIRGEEVGPNLARRLDTAARCWEKNPRACVIVCGGQGPEETITEALAMKRYLIQKGVPESQIIEEDTSTSTYENLQNAKEILDERFPDGYSALLVTSDFHIFRAVRLAGSLGLNVDHVGAPTVWYTVPSNYFREMMAITKTWLLP